MVTKWLEKGKGIQLVMETIITNKCLWVLPLDMQQMEGRVEPLTSTRRLHHESPPATPRCVAAGKWIADHGTGATRHLLVSPPIQNVGIGFACGRLDLRPQGGRTSEGHPLSREQEMKGPV
ncbi:hypothetical protein DPEC_G00293670 [Dallia pectoralis]|uniref:Uncharacterized protein n=1 Tax=Dallia pectoralis TaxID=75939 RepID=A0ACC2FIE0_DALPE|nr:hypothetical protein DPEC_G00293670 [Dallia pectoralis]